jgi:two-component system invasion response regulator UvrY
MENNELIKVVLIDDHILLRSALGGLIDKSGVCQVVYQCNNGIHFIEEFGKNPRPDVVLLDMNMPEMNGYETAIWLRDKHPEINVLMLTMYDSELALIRLLQVGVKGFLKKDIHPAELVNAIKAVHEQGYYYSSQTSSKLASLFRDSSDKNSLLHKVMLDAQEIDFLKLACTEMTYKEIAQEMKLNPRSIDGIRDNLFSRLDVKSRVGLAIYAIRHGLVSP